MIKKSAFLTTLAAGALAASASAQITLLEYQFLQLDTTPGPFSYTIAGATDNSVLVFGYYADVTGPAFNFTTDVGTIAGQINGERASAFYIGGVSTGQTFTIGFDNNPVVTSGAAYVAVLNGVDLTNPIVDTSLLSPNAEPVAPFPTIDRVANGYIFQFQANNRNGTIPEYTGSDLTPIANSVGGGIINGADHNGTFDVAIATVAGFNAGTFTLNGSSWSNTNERNNDEIAYSFNPLVAVPESSAFPLVAGALSLGFVATRRRRA